MKWSKEEILELFDLCIQILPKEFEPTVIMVNDDLKDLLKTDEHKGLVISYSEHIENGKVFISSYKGEII